jgi:hypothetical protein
MIFLWNALLALFALVAIYGLLKSFVSWKIITENKE